MCSICLSKKINNCVITPCDHTFCRDCLDKWFQIKKYSCPLCRNKFDTIFVKCVEYNCYLNFSKNRPNTRFYTELKNLSNEIKIYENARHLPYWEIKNKFYNLLYKFKNTPILHKKNLIEIYNDRVRFYSNRYKEDISQLLI